MTNPMKKNSINFVFFGTPAFAAVFLDDLEKSLRIADVTSLAFSSDKGAKNTYGVAIKTYWLNNPPKP